MKKVAFLLALVMLLSMLCACAGGDANKTETATSTQTEQTEQTADASSETSEASQSEGLDTANPVYFAWAGPMTGDMKQYGDTARESIAMAVEDVNANGGVLGRELVVDYYDDKNDATEAINLANKIVDEGKYVAVIGHFSSTCSMAAAPIYQEAGLIEYSATCSHADYSAVGDYIFRNLLTQAVEARAYADFLYTDCGYESVGVLYVNDDWGKNTTDNFVSRYEELGGKVLVKEGFISGQTKDFTPMISKIKEANPDAFFTIAMYADTAQVLIQADSLDYDAPKIVSTAVFKQELIDVAGDLANGVILLNIFPTECDNEAFNRVMNTYYERTGKMGDFHVMCNYDVTAQLANAVNVAGTTDIPAVRDALANTEYEGIAGPYTMDELGDAQRSTAPATIIDGKFARYTPGE